MAQSVCSRSGSSDPHRAVVTERVPTTLIIRNSCGCTGAETATTLPLGPA